MKKYILRFDACLAENVKGGTASFKAPADVREFARARGYEEYLIHIEYRFGTFYRIINCIWQLIRFGCRIPEDSIVLYQYPDFHPIPMLFVMFFFQKRIMAIIHDVNSVRNKGYLVWSERKLLNKFYILIVHTENMKHFLKKENKIERPRYYVINAFPYIAEIDKSERENAHEVCFAGNIDKSRFLLDFCRSNQRLSIQLYGSKKITDVSSFDNVTYNGMFRPDNVVGIKGSWGLVWDGDSTTTCSGNMGAYHKIIAPHKFSLFVVAGMPVIAWSNSAMADLIKEEGIGLCVDSIADLYVELSKVDNERYYKLQHNILRFAQEEIVAGKSLLEIFNKVSV